MKNLKTIERLLLLEERMIKVNAESLNIVNELQKILKEAVK